MTDSYLSQGIGGQCTFKANESTAPVGHGILRRHRSTPFIMVELATAIRIFTNACDRWGQMPGRLKDHATDESRASALGAEIFHINGLICRFTTNLAILRHFRSIRSNLRYRRGAAMKRRMPHMTVIGKLSGILIISFYLAGCSSSPTAPTANPPATTPPVAVTPPVVTPPVTVAPPVTPTPPPVLFPPNDPRFDLGFYRQFVHDALEYPSRPDVLRRHAQAPRIYLRTVHTNGSTIDAFTLDQTARALEETAGKLTGVFGLAGLERGTGTREGQPGWITVRWTDDPQRRFCGYANYGGDWIDLYPSTSGCRCSGGPAVTLSTIKHELGHALGFRHTESRDDLMYRQIRQCDMEPSAREQYHAALAYTRPNGSAAP